MKKALFLLVIIGIIATPAMAFDTEGKYLSFENGEYGIVNNMMVIRHHLMLVNGVHDMYGDEGKDRAGAPKVNLPKDVVTEMGKTMWQRLIRIKNVWDKQAFSRVVVSYYTVTLVKAWDTEWENQLDVILKMFNVPDEKALTPKN